MRISTILTTLLLVVVAVQFSQAQLARQWVARYGGLKTGTDAATAITADDTGNVYVTGYSAGSGGNNIVTIKYSPQGNRAWLATYAGSGDTRGKAIARDTMDNIYVLASTDSGGSANYMVIKYDSTGTQKWIALYDGPAHAEDIPVAIAVNDSMNVFVVGASTGISSGFDYSLVKYDKNGARLWEKRYNGPANGSDKPVGMALSGSALYVGGTITDTLSDYGIIKYNAYSGDSVWFAKYNGPANGNDFAKAMYLGSSGNIYITGASQGVGTGLDYATLKFNSSGVEQWCSRYNGPLNGDDVPAAMAVNGSTRVFVTGQAVNIGSYTDAVTVCYNASNGSENWVNAYDGPGGDDDVAVAITNGSNPYLVVAASVDGAGKDYALVSLKGSTGSTQSTEIYGASGYADDIPAAIQTSGNSVYLTGKSFGLKTGYDYLTINFRDSKHLYLRTFTQAELVGKAASLKTPTAVANIANVRDAAFLAAFPKLKKGFAGAPGGMVIGKVRSDSAAAFGWIRVGKGAALGAMVPATGTPRGFALAEVVGEKKEPKVSKYDNKLVGDLLALKLSIGASDAQITPPTLGDLVYDDGDTANHYNGMSLRQLVSFTDNVLTYSMRYTDVHYDTLDAMIARVNTAFSGPLTTASVAPLMASGVKLIDSVGFLQPGIAPLQDPLQFEKGSIEEVPKEYTLYQNYPNPFNPTTTIQFDLPEHATVTLKVYDMLGREVATLYNRQELEEGVQDVTFDASSLSSGVYFYRLVAEESRFQMVKKMVLLK